MDVHEADEEPDARLQEKRKRVFASYLFDGAQRATHLSRTTEWRRRKLRRTLEVPDLPVEEQHEEVGLDVPSSASTNSTSSVSLDSDSESSGESDNNSTVSSKSRHEESSREDAEDSESLQNDVLCHVECGNLNTGTNNSEYFKIRINDNLSIGDLFFMTYSYSIRNNLTQKATEHLLKLLNIVVNEQILPSSKYQYEKKILHNAPEQHTHFYCSNCHSYLFRVNSNDKNVYDGSCRICKVKFSTKQMNLNCYFVTVSIKDQLKVLLENDEFFQLLLKCQSENLGRYVGTNRLSGSIYKKNLRAFLSNPNNYTLTIYTDGAKKHKSSLASAWPVFMKFDAIPQDCQQSILCALWYGPKQPNMTAILRPIVNEMKLLYEEGIEWKKNDSVVNSKFAISCFVADTPARAKVMCFIGHMGRFSCLFCIHPGEETNVGRSGKRCIQIRYPESEKIFELRTHEQILDDVELAIRQKSVVRGLKGSSPLIELPLFRVPDNVAVDLLHVVCKGEILAYISYVVENSGEPYHIGSFTKIHHINLKLSQLKPFSLLQRIPRNLSDYKFYTAKELLHFLLFFGPVVFRNVLPLHYLKQFSLLSHSIFLLLQDTITNSDLLKAEEMILHYVLNAKKLFGQRFCVSNNHLLTHLVEDVRKFGSLHNHSTFEYESDNGWLLRMIKSTKGVCQQAIKKYLLHTTLQNFTKANNLEVSYEAQNFLNDLLGGKRRKAAYTSQEVTALGKGSKYETPENIKVLFPQIQNNFILSFQRAIVNGKIFSTSQYCNAKKHDDSCLQTLDGRYFLIKFIIKFEQNHDIFFIVNEIFSQQNEHIPAHIAIVTAVDPEISFLEPSIIKNKIMKLDVSGESFVMMYPSEKLVD